MIRFFTPLLLIATLGLSVTNFAFIMKPSLAQKVKSFLTTSKPVAKSEQNGWISPAIANFGKVHYLEEDNKTMVDLPDPNKQYKVFLNIKQASKSLTQVNPSLDRVAKIINAYTANGVPKKNIKVVGIISGDATASILKDEAYKKKFNMNNPNTVLIHELHDYGVELSICAQSLYGAKFTPKDVNPEIKLGYSSLVSKAEYARKGYSVIII